LCGEKGQKFFNCHMRELVDKFPRR
jgi:hypothetical protein